MWVGFLIGPRRAAFAWKTPFDGKSEGWTAATPEAVLYLSTKGTRCVATDAPTLGGANLKYALWTYWLLGTRGMLGIENLTNVAAARTGAYFAFAPLKIGRCHGGPGGRFPYSSAATTTGLVFQQISINP